MKKDIVVIEKNEGRAGTVLIAEGFNRRHEHIVRLIKKYRKEFEEINHLKWFIKRGKTKSFEEFLLDEDQFLFLGTLFKNNDQIVNFKLRLVKEFRNCRRRLNRALNQNRDPKWNQARLTSKTLRIFETGVIKEFIAYAKAQGGTPKGCDNYYTNFTRLVNISLFICEGKFKNLRDVLTPEQLMIVGAAEQMIRKTLREEMNANVFYKDIYQSIKKKVIAFADLSGQTEVLAPVLEEIIQTEQKMLDN